MLHSSTDLQSNDRRYADGSEAGPRERLQASEERAGCGVRSRPNGDERRRDACGGSVAEVYRLAP